MGKHDAGPSAGCVAMLVGALALALTCHLVSVGRGPLGGPGALPQRFPLAFARPMRQRVATETPPTQEKVVDLLPIGRMNDTTRLRPIRAHSTGLSELTPRSTQSAFESLMERRAGVYAGGPEPRPGWLADTVLVTAANWNYMQMLKNWECHAAKYDLDWVVIAMDTKVHEALGPGRSFLIKGEHIETGGHAFRSKEFNTITCNKFSAVVDILASGRDVVFSDPDNVFVGDPFADTGFGSLGGMIRSDRYEFIYSVNLMTDGDDHARAEKRAQERAYLANGEEPFYDIRGRRTMGNTGFYWIKSTPSAIEMLNFTVAECAVGDRGWDDQTHLWQNVIKRIKKKALPPPHYAGTDHCTQKSWDAPAVARAWSPKARIPLRWCNLDVDKYVTGQNVTWPNLVTYHANFATGSEQKIDKLKTWNPVGLWMLGADKDNTRCLADASEVEQAPSFPTST